MKGVIFAAGLGTRLYPFTKDRPKALVEVKGLTMLEHTLAKFQNAGIDEIVVNVHAFADKVEDWLKNYEQLIPSVKIDVSDERSLLLETGGGLKKMEPLLCSYDEPFLVHNVDILSDINLKMLIDKDSDFNYSRHIATLAVRKTESDRYFLFNQEGFLCGWENVRTGEQKISRPNETNLLRYGFTGIHVIHPRLFDLMTEEGVFSITDVYIRLAKDYDIRMVDVSDSAWFDIGSPEQLKIAEEKFV
jgi:NDP-sugar pyrophosphorylase family protein